jgi:hypothetical protein
MTTDQKLRHFVLLVDCTFPTLFSDVDGVKNLISDC